MSPSLSDALDLSLSLSREFELARPRERRLVSQAVFRLFEEEISEALRHTPAYARALQTRIALSLRKALGVGPLVSSARASPRRARSLSQPHANERREIRF